MGDLIERLYDYYLSSAGVTTDSRQVKPGDIFFALKGERFDGNRYAQAALDKGARYAVVDDPSVKTSRDFILVEDVLVTLQALARYHRMQLDIPVLALTGSNGKTTTKELLRCALEQQYRVHATEGNLNNHIGVPLTLLAMPRDADFAIVEMGASAPGEIAFLCDIAAPNYGLVTNIGEAHLEGFGSVEGVKAGKGELYDYLAAHDGVAFFNADEPFLEALSRRVRHRIGYGSARPEGYEGSFIAVRSVETAGQVVAKVPEDGWDYRIFSPLTGAHNFENVKTAAAVSKYFRLTFAQIKYGIETYQPANMRSQYISFGDNRVLLDAYNANPSSMERALRAFVAGTGGQYRVAVLGDMLELGEFADALHRRVLTLAEGLGFDEIWLVGPLFAGADVEGRARHFRDVTELRAWLAGKTYSGVSFFVKGSRGMRLEEAFMSAR